MDEGLAALTDPDDIRRHREVNKINPGNITIIILDDDGKCIYSSLYLHIIIHIVANFEKRDNCMYNYMYKG